MLRLLLTELTLSCAVGGKRDHWRLIFFATDLYRLQKTYIICLPTLWETHKRLIPDIAHSCRWKELSFPDKTEMDGNSQVHQMMKSNKSGLQVIHVDDFTNLIYSLSGAAEIQ